MPRDVLVARPRAEEVKSAADVRDLVPPVVRRFTSPHGSIPRTHVLSNGRYAVMVTAAGSGYSRWQDVAVTRWREDVTRDSWGSYLFLRDMQTGAVWSAGHQPSGREADSYEVILLRGSRRVLPSRRLDRDALDRRRVGGARRGDPPRVADQSRLARSRDRADVVRGDRFGAAGGRCRSPGLPEPVRADRVRARHRSPPGDPPSTVQRREADLGRTCRGGRGGDRRGPPVRNGSRPLPRPGPVGPLTGLGHRRASALEHRRRRAGSDLQPPVPGQARPRRDRPRDLLHGRRRVARAGPGPGRQVP
jgi:hypothetical protein